jgi:hypothetical protein
MTTPDLRTTRVVAKLGREVRARTPAVSRVLRWGAFMAGVRIMRNIQSQN